MLRHYQSAGEMLHSCMVQFHSLQHTYITNIHVCYQYVDYFLLQLKAPQVHFVAVREHNSQCRDGNTSTATPLKADVVEYEQNFTLIEF